MKRRLYPNMKHMTTLFCIAIVCVTLTTLALRLTVFSDMAVYASHDQPSRGQAAVAEGDDQVPYRIATTVRFSNAEARGKIGIENPESNEYYLMVSVILPDTQDVIIYTGLIPPGESRDEVTLDVNLEPGTYECVAEVSVYDLDNLQNMGQDELTITVQVG